MKTQVELDNIHALIILGTSTNKKELTEVYWYGYIAANDEAGNNFTVFDLHLSYTRSKKMWNQMIIN